MQLLDHHKLARLLEFRITDAELEKGVPERELPRRSRAQELARRMGYARWRNPAFIYSVIRGERAEMTIDWIIACANALGVQVYYLLSDELIREVLRGFGDETSNSRHPEVVVARITGEPLVRVAEEGAEYGGLEKLMGGSRSRQQTNGIYSIIVNDPAMASVIPPGSVVELDAARPYEDGNLHLVTARSGESWIRLVFR